MGRRGLLHTQEKKKGTAHSDNWLRATCATPRRACEGNWHSSWAAVSRLLPEGIRIICAPGARACGGSDRGAKAGIPRHLAPTCDKMRKVRNCQKRAL
eukprot:gene10294-biopygen9325